MRLRMRRPFIVLAALFMLAGCAAGPSPFGTAGVHTLRPQFAAASAAAMPSPAQLLPDRLVAADGAELPLRIWAPAEPPRAALVALHGFNDYSNAFDLAGSELARDG